MSESGQNEAAKKEGAAPKSEAESLALAAAFGAGVVARRAGQRLAQAAADGILAALSGVWMIVSLLGLMIGTLMGCAGALLAPLSLSFAAIQTLAPSIPVEGAFGMALQWGAASLASVAIVAVWGRRVKASGSAELGEREERFIERRSPLWRELIRSWMLAQERLGEAIFKAGQEAAARPLSLRAGVKVAGAALLAAPGGAVLGLSAGPGLIALWLAQVGKALGLLGKAAGARLARLARSSSGPRSGQAKERAGEASESQSWARRAALALAKEGAGTEAYAKAQRRALERETDPGAAGRAKRL